MRLSSARLAALFVLIFAAGVTLLLTTVYILTARVLDREVDAVITGGGQRASSMTMRAAACCRSSRACIVAPTAGDDRARSICSPKRTASRSPAIWHAGRATSQSTKAGSSSRSMRASYGGVMAHPVRAQVFGLPERTAPAVGTDILDRRVLASRLRTAMLWGVGLCVALATLVGFSYSRRVRRRVRAIADACETIMAGDLSQRLPVEGCAAMSSTSSPPPSTTCSTASSSRPTMLRTTFDSAAHDLRAPLYRARVRIEETLQHADLGGAARETMEATLAELERVQRTLGTLLQIAQADGRGRDVTDGAGGSRGARARTGRALSARGGRARHRARHTAARTPRSISGNRQLLAQALVNLHRECTQVRAGRRARDGERGDSTATRRRSRLRTTVPASPTEDRQRVSAAIRAPRARSRTDRQRSGSEPRRRRHAPASAPRSSCSTIIRADRALRFPQLLRESRP